jgi:hypothetical protein
VRRLIKVAKECKRAHTRATEKPKQPSTPPREPEENPVEHLLGKSFAEAIRKPPAEDDVSELDLDFLPDEARVDEPSSGFPSDPANAHLTAGNALGGVLTGNRPTSLPLSSLNILQRTDHAPGPTSDAESLYVQNGAVQLSMKHSALSRAFVRTIGRLGRWKRAESQIAPDDDHGAMRRRGVCVRPGRHCTSRSAHQERRGRTVPQDDRTCCEIAVCSCHHYCACCDTYPLTNSTDTPDAQDAAACTLLRRNAVFSPIACTTSTLDPRHNRYHFCHFCQRASTLSTLSTLTRTTRIVIGTYS